jgi:hypothetical protein
MELNVTYHWTYLDYLHITPENRKNGNFGPVACAEIEVRTFLPTAYCLKETRESYDRIRIPISGTMEPTQEIIQTIQRYADEHNIEILMDYINPDYKNDWDEPF